MAPRQGWRREPRPRPRVGEVAVTGAAEDDAVVEPVAPSGPELDLVAHDAPTAPEVGHRDVMVAAVVGEALENLLPPALQLVPVGGGARLVRRPCGEPRPVGPGVEVGLDLVAADELGGAAEADRAVEGRPGERCRDPRVGLQVLALGRAEVGDETGSTRVEEAHQDGAHVRCPGRVHGGDRERRGLGHVVADLGRRDGGIDPGPGLQVGRGRDVGLDETVAGVVDATHGSGAPGGGVARRAVHAPRLGLAREGPRGRQATARAVPATVPARPGR